MLRTAAAVVVLAATILPSTALACAMRVPTDEMALEELFAEIDEAEPEVAPIEDVAQVDKVDTTTPAVAQTDAPAHPPTPPVVAAKQKS